MVMGCPTRQLQNLRGALCYSGMKSPRIGILRACIQPDDEYVVYLVDVSFRPKGVSLSACL